MLPIHRLGHPLPEGRRRVRPVSDVCCFFAGSLLMQYGTDSRSGCWGGGVVNGCDQWRAFFTGQQVP